MKLHKLPLYLSFSIIALVIVFAGCDVNDNTSQGKGHISVQLTDAPAHYDAVYIDIQSVLIKTDETDDVNQIDEDNNDTEQDGWIAINDDPVRVNLLDLRNGETIQLGDEELDAGTYHQIRLILGSNNEVVVDGESHALKTPSAQQSGLKLNINASINYGQTYNLLVDFDAARSIVATGSKKYILKPVLHSVNLEEASAISGTVKPTRVQTLVMAIAHGDTLSTLTDTDGKFTILGASSGTYNIVFNPKSDAYAETSQTDVMVKETEDLDLGTINLEAL